MGKVLLWPPAAGSGFKSESRPLRTGRMQAVLEMLWKIASNLARRPHRQRCGLRAVLAKWAALAQQCSRSATTTFTLWEQLSWRSVAPSLLEPRAPYVAAYMLLDKLVWCALLTFYVHARPLRIIARSMRP